MHGGGHSQRGGGEFFAQRRFQCRARCNLDELLIATLQRAFALTERHDIAAVTKHLDLDVARMRQPLFHEHRAHAEGCLRLGAATFEGGAQIGRVLYDAQAAPTATGDGLNHHRSAGPKRCHKVLRGRKCVDRRSPWQQGHTTVAGEVAALFLVAEGFKLLWFRANENEGRRAAGAGEVGALREESVPWMHGVAAGLHREREQTLDIEVSSGTGGTKRQAAVGGTRV